MTKVVATCALHYGTPYLGYAIRSVIDYVDEFWIIYSHLGSHGGRSDQPCPDTRDQLYGIAKQAAGLKLRWSDGVWPAEGTQREMIYHLAPDTDVILSVDYDEIWPGGLPEIAIRTALAGDVRHYRVPFVHAWRSFRRFVLHDPAFPVRVTNMNIQSGEKYLDSNGYSIAHMGYAIPPALVRYKMAIHGHRGQWRTDCDWFKDKFLANAQVDCHPVGSEYWQPEAVDPWQYLPPYMRQHPYADMEVIE